MADNFQASNGSTTFTFAADDIGGGTLVSRVKQVVGPDGTGADAWTLSKLLSAATTNATSVKNAPGTLGMLIAVNVTATVYYLKLFNKASAPTVGSDAPVMTIPIPANSSGAGIALNFGVGLAFSVGIGLAITSGVADLDTGSCAANAVILTLGYA